jgi:putative SOS response-associated peptidase YedK
MSSRYSISLNAAALEKRFEIDVPAGYKPRYNAAPSQLLPVITNTGSAGLSFFYWGIAPEWAKNKAISEKLIHTREDGIKEKPALRKTLQKQRCLIPADGFYAWKRVGKKTQIPYRFELKNKQSFAIAGLWEEYDDENGTFIHTFTLITTKANDVLSPFQDSMPVLMETGLEKEWLRNDLSEEKLLNCLKSNLSNQLDFFSISPRINNLINDDAMLMRPAPASDQFGNLTLFD